MRRCKGHPVYSMKASRTRTDMTTQTFDISRRRCWIDVQLARQFDLVAIPYLGTVILLPLFVFLRCYSLCFLEQFGPSWRILWEPATYKCPKCRTLYDKVEVTVFNNDKVVHKSRFRCKECRSRLRLTNIHRLKKAICPKCHQRTFQRDYSQHVLWD